MTRDLKLIAMDAEDLAILSAHLQDAVLRVGDMAYLKAEKRFAALANRFDWSSAAAGSDASRFTRRRAGLRFERVLGAQVAGLDLSAADTVVSLLAIEFTPSGTADSPDGTIQLRFSGGTAVRLSVECIEAELRDLGAAWSTPRKPAHPLEEPGGTS